MSKKGFTLVELLVVIAIIGVLLSILIPSLNRAKLLAQGIVCLSNLKSMTTAWNTFVMDNDEILVNGGASRTVNPWPHIWVEAPEKSVQVYLGDNLMTTADEERGIQDGLFFS